MEKFRAWCRLCRAPQTITLMADPVAGALIAGAGFRETLDVVGAMLAAGLFFMTGVVLNDWYDVKRDKAEHPRRPLPAGTIPRYQAFMLMLMLLALGMAFAPMAGPRATAVGLLLVATTLAYNAILKNIPLAPVILGVYRGMNLWLGMAIMAPDESAASTLLRAYLALAIGIYATAMAIFAHKSNYFDGPQRFVTGAGGMVLAVVMLPLIGLFFSGHAYHDTANLWVAGLLGVLLWKLVPAVQRPEARRIEPAATTAFLATIGFDAAAVALLRGIAPSAIVLILLVPAVKLHAWLNRK